MTRATLLQLLAHPTALNGADVRALEQLADAFPYCQTAHLLLAKAAHDQGSMLAGQRLRRAATYAADRTRLRQLLEQTTPVAVPAELARAESAAALMAVVPLVAPAPVTSIITAEDIEQQAIVSFEDKPDQVISQAAAEVAPTSEVPPTYPADEEELPVQAPPIRPPAEAAVARLEFGLAEQEPAEITAYRLPELAEVAAPPLPATPRLPVFTGIAEISYVPGEGSRLGFCLVPAGAARPETSLPPAGEFFAPDALLLAHLAAHQEPALPKPSSISLIDSFLQRAPAVTRRRALPSSVAAEPDAQADLSVRSTRAEPDLASESLAKILARQGKTERAIAVYERLMVKQPEKMAYFAAQIDSLRPSA